MTKEKTLSHKKKTLSADFQLRGVEKNDLSIFYEQQLDPDANYMAAFTTKDPADRQAFESHWERVLADPKICIKTIVVDKQIAGYIASFERFSNQEVSYWIGRHYWDRGIATQALSEFLRVVKIRPLFARAAKDNIASIRVLEKCGFAVFGYDKAFAEGRCMEVEETIFKYDN